MEGKFETQFKKIVGGKSEQEKKEAHDELQRLIEVNSYEDTKDYEIEPTEKDKEIVKFVTETVDKIISSFGGLPISFPEKKIFIVKEKSVKDISNGKFNGGFHSILKQRVVVERNKLDVDFAVSLAHELFHLKSFKSAQIIDGEVYPYRSGFSIYDRSVENEYFAQLEEAIVSEATRIFYAEKIKNNELFKAEIEKIERVKELYKQLLESKGLYNINYQRYFDQIYWINEADEIINFLESDVKSSDPVMYKLGYLEGSLLKLSELGEVSVSERYKERKEFYKLLDEIIEKSNGQYKDREDLFKEFAIANFSGRLTSLAKTIENILGRGSFRDIAERFKKTLKEDDKDKEGMTNLML